MSRRAWGASQLQARYPQHLTQDTNFTRAEGTLIGRAGHTHTKRRAHRFGSIGADRAGHELHRVGRPIGYAGCHRTRGKAQEQADHRLQARQAARARPN
jgi:hypothetical protein